MPGGCAWASDAGSRPARARASRCGRRRPPVDSEEIASFVAGLVFAGHTLCANPSSAPAVLNAIAKATGKRVRNLPLMNNDLKKGA